MDLEEVWRIREEEIYPSLFGVPSDGIYPLSHDIFARQFRQENIDPRWLTHGVFQFPPTGNRKSWIYATSGYSNPWEVEPDAYDSQAESGAGVEFVFQTTEPGDWAILTLQRMLAFDMLLAAGRFPGKTPLGFGDRIPLHAPLNGDETCEIRNLVMVEPEGIPSDFTLPSGKVIFASFTGITDLERDLAKEAGSDVLIERLRLAGYHPVTNPSRPSLGNLG
jgi:hypothetical protein